MEALEMTSFSRSFAMAFLVGAMIGTLVGCGQPKPKALEEIASQVPRLTDLPLTNPTFPGPSARRVLAIVGLKVGDVTIEETKEPSLDGQVFDQDPPPGTKVRGGTAVDVKVYRFVPAEKEGSSEERK